MSVRDVLSEELMKPSAKRVVCDLLRRLPLPLRRKKEVYIEWARDVGVVVSEDDVVAAVGQRI